MANKYDVVISFDTTGSMSSCINEVRKNVTEIVNRLFSEIEGIRIGIVAHGDYCDEKTTYLMKSVDLCEAANKNKIVSFIKETGNTGGGDYPEAYEYVLREVQKMSWSSESLRALVMIGDAYPHDVDSNPHKIDWKNEVKELKDMGINIYSVQALKSGSGLSYTFYKQMAQMTNGYHLFLDQFSYIRDMLLAICFKQVGEERLMNYEQEMVNRNVGMNNSMRKMFDTMLGRASTVVENIAEESAVGASGEAEDEEDEGDGILRECPPAKYQVLTVDRDMSIKEFVAENGLEFKAGKGFYEFTKPETISPKKLVVLMKKDTHQLYEGNHARKIAKIGKETKKYKPTDLADYRMFIQSTSYNRKLIAGQGFLYEAADFGMGH